MDLLLHIGAEKTGTTSLQKWFHDNADALARQGIHYARSLGRPNNRRISYYALDLAHAKATLRTLGVSSSAQQETLRQTIATELLAEIAQARAAGCNRFVISNEHCQSLLPRAESVDRVRDLVAPHFDTVQICCFLRPQLDTCLSLASTAARQGTVVSLDWIKGDLKPHLPYYNLLALLDRWAGAFGRAAILPVPFARHQDVIAFFTDHLRIDPIGFVRRQPVNEALDYRTITICNAMRMPWLIDGRANQLGQFFVNELPVEQRLTIDRQLAQRLQARFDAQNAALVASWPPLTLADLTPEWSRYPAIGNVDRLDAANEIGSQLRAMVERFNADLWHERARCRLAESQREQALGRLEQSAALCQQAIDAAGYAALLPQRRWSAEKLIAACQKHLAVLNRRQTSRHNLDTPPN